MAAVLWIVAAAMQLAAVIALGVLGFGFGFLLLEGFVLLTFALTWMALEAERR